MPSVNKTKTRHPVRALVFLTNPTVILIAAIIMLVSWRIPTNVEIELVVEGNIFVGDENSFLKIVNEKEIVIKEGRMNYPDYPDVQTIFLTSPEFIQLEPEGSLQVRQLQAEGDGTLIHIEGTVKTLLTGKGENLQDRRLSLFNSVRRSPKMVWFGIGAWLFATVIGWYRVYRELN